MFDWIGDFFKALFDLIPKVIYLLYSSLACVLDVLQLFFRKLAGLDVYYVDGKAVAGDLVTNFIAGIIGINLDGNDVIEYSALTTVFWAFIIFGIIICFASTLIAVIKSHYSYDEKAAKGPMQYVYTALKSMVNIAAVPVIVVLALYVSQALLTAIDTITSVDSGTVVSMFGETQVTDTSGEIQFKSVASQYLEKVDTAKNVSGTGNVQDESKMTYIYYDIFGFAANITYGPKSNPHDWPQIPKKQTALIGAANQTFSGSLFKVAAYNANRARLGYFTVNAGNYTGSRGTEFPLFQNAETLEDLANMIDNAFACALHVKDGKAVELNYDFSGGIASTKYFTNWYARGISAFSKFNVGAVWYYYDLWNFNFIVGFGACIVCISIFINIVLGLITRLFMTIGLFLIAPPLFGLAPMDGGKAAKKWCENFVKQVLMTYGAVYGMNIMFLILPYINRINFFNIAIADYFAQTLIIIAGLITIKALIATVSSIIGAEDANTTGDKLAKEVAETAVAGRNATFKTVKGFGTMGKLTGRAVGGAARLGGNLVGGAGSLIGAAGSKISEKTHLGKALNDEKNIAQNKEILDAFNDPKKNQAMRDAARDISRAQNDSYTKEQRKGFQQQARQQLKEAGLNKRQIKMYEDSIKSERRERLKSAEEEAKFLGLTGQAAKALAGGAAAEYDKNIGSRDNGMFKAMLTDDSANRESRMYQNLDRSMRAQANASSRVKYSGRRMKRAAAVARSGVKAAPGMVYEAASIPAEITKTVLGGSPFIKAYREGINKPEDYQESSAKALKAIQKHFDDEDKEKGKK